MSKRYEFKWTSSNKSSLQNLISGMERRHPEEYSAIQAISEKLFNAYRTSDRITEEQAQLLDRMKNDWHIDPENGGVVINYLYADDIGLLKKGWGDESRGERKKRRDYFEKVKEIEFSYVYSLSVRSCKFKKFWKNFPKRCNSFSCYGNGLTSLKGGPTDVKDYECSFNKLTSLSGIPKNVEHLSCSNNSVSTLSTLRVKKLKKLDCRNNDLTDLVGCPEVTEGLNVSKNKLTSVKGAPLNLTLRELDFSKNVVSEKTLKLAFNAMKKAKGDYELGLSKIWKNIPVEDKLHMYQDNPYLSEDDVKKYASLKKYSNIKNLI